MSDDTRDLAKRFTAALHALDRDAERVEEMVELFAEDARLANAAMDLEGESRAGKEGAHAFWQTYRAQFTTAETEFHHVTTSECDEGRAAGLFWTTRGEASNGESLDYHGASLLVFDANDKVSVFRGYYDTRQLVVHESGA